MFAIGKATQDVFLIGGKIFEPKCEHAVCFEKLPLGAKLDLENVVFATGGNATNAATTFARQGLHTEYMWVLGTDVASQAIMTELDAENIQTTGVVQDKKYRVSYSTILLAPTGERTILNFHGSMLGGDGHPLDLNRIAGADWLYLSALGDLDLLEKIITLAAKHKVKVAINPAGNELAHPRKFKALLEDVEVLIANKEEMKQLVEGDSAEELARHALNYVSVAIVSDGPKGAVATDGKTVVTAGMYEDVKVVDRLGAGDAFGSGFVSAIAQGKTLEEAVVFASANSTSVVTKIGAKAGILHKGVELHDMPLKTKDF